MFKQLAAWGFTKESWKGRRGEYWVLAQGLLMIAYVAMPRYNPWYDHSTSYILYPVWVIASLVGLSALYLLGRGIVDLGISLTPLPYPRNDGQLVDTGVYKIVRHCLYSSIVLLAIAGTLFWLSVSHLVMTIVLFLFFDAKANQEEEWLCQRYPGYHEYKHRVKKLLPGIY